MFSVDTFSKHDTLAICENSWNLSKKQNLTTQLPSFCLYIFFVCIIRRVRKHLPVCKWTPERNRKRGGEGFRVEKKQREMIRGHRASLLRKRLQEAFAWRTVCLRKCFCGRFIRADRYKPISEYYLPTAHSNDNR